MTDDAVPPSEQGAPVRVLVADDHPMWRESVARDLEESGYQVVATAANGAEAVRRAAATSPQVVLADLQMPGVDGVEATRQIVWADPRVRVLVLSASGEQADVLEAVKAGATGYLVKSASRAELLEAVARTAAGRRRLHARPRGARAGGVPADVERAGRRPRHRRAVDLSPTARPRCCAWWPRGRPYKEIAGRLVLSHRTVQNHVQNILGKLQMHNRVELVRYAIATGLEDPTQDDEGR